MEAPTIQFEIHQYSNDSDSRVNYDHSRHKYTIDSAPHLFYSLSELQAVDKLAVTVGIQGMSQKTP